MSGFPAAWLLTYGVGFVLLVTGGLAVQSVERLARRNREAAWHLALLEIAVMAFLGGCVWAWKVGH